MSLDSRRWIATSPGLNGEMHLGFGFGEQDAREALDRYLATRGLPPANPDTIEAHPEPEWDDGPDWHLKPAPFCMDFASDFAAAVASAGIKPCP